MFRVTFRSLRARKARLLTTGIAILLGVAFMAGTLVYTDTLTRSMDELVGTVVSKTDVSVRGPAAFSTQFSGVQRPRVYDSLIVTVRHVDGVGAAAGSITGFTQVIGKDGKGIGKPGAGPPTLGVAWIDDVALNALKLNRGRAPTAADEVVLDVSTAEKSGYQIGDRLTVVTPQGPTQVRLVGTALYGTSRSALGATLVAFTLKTAQQLIGEPAKVDAVMARGTGAVDPDTLRQRVAKAVPASLEVVTGSELKSESEKAFHDGFAFFNTLMLTFALIGLFVGCFTIYNTFSILVAQRTRENALLRALGATKGQVTAGVVLEAIALGLVASVAGLFGGLAIAAGIKKLISAIGVDMPVGGLLVNTRTIVVAVAAGVGITVLASLLPARRASRVAPLAALRETAVERPPASMGRLVGGLAITGVGIAAGAAGLFARAGFGATALGMALIFFGMAVLGPAVARPVARILGAPVAWLRGIPGKLARDNAMRNPRRTAATATALLIGVALVGFVTVLASSITASIDQVIDRQFKGDLVVSSHALGAGGFSPALAAELQALPTIDTATGLRVGYVKIAGSVNQVVGGDAERVNAIVDIGVKSGDLNDLGQSPDTVAVSEKVATDKGWRLGDVVDAQFAETGPARLRIALIFRETQVVGSYFFGLRTYDVHFALHADAYVYVKLAPGIEVSAGRQEVEGILANYPNADLQDRAQFKTAQSAGIRQILGLFYAMLALAVVIALTGIASTLSLSILERRREIGLLRALGTTRSQVRAAVRWEASILSLFGAVGGLGLGVAFGWAAGRALAAEGLTAFHVPVPSLAMILVIAVLAATLAAVRPARRAARLDVLQAIASE